MGFGRLLAQTMSTRFLIISIQAALGFRRGVGIVWHLLSRDGWMGRQVATSIWIV